MTFKSPTQPLCRTCGKAIRKRTKDIRVHLTEPASPDMTSEWTDGKWRQVPARMITGRFETKAAIQRTVNETVVAIRFNYVTENGDPTGEKYIDRISVWDGESYQDEFFCNGEHAKDFAYMCASSPKLTICSVAWQDAVRRQREKASKS